MRKLVLQVEFFNDFTEAEIETVLTFMDQFIRFRPDELILCQGKTDDLAMFVLLTGRCVVTSGKQHVYLSEVMAGEFFGEISFMSEKPRTANVVASEASIVWRIDHQLLTSIPSSLREKIQQKIINKLVDVISQSNRKLSDSLI